MKVKVVQGLVILYSTVFVVKVECPALTTGTPTAVNSYTVPVANAATPTAVMAMSAYITTNPSALAACAPSSFTLVQTDGSTFTSTWLTIVATDGTVNVDTNALGDQSVKVKYSHGGSDHESSAF